MIATYANMAVEAIQSGKQTWVNTFVKDETLKKTLTDYVQTQTAFVKQANKTAVDVATRFTDATVGKLFDK